MNRDRCINPSIKYRPQWPAIAPAGFRYETHFVPFVFQNVPATGQLVRGLPLTLEDDQPFIIRGIFIPMIGTVQAVGSAGQGLCRVWDSRGNPLSQGLVLGLGQWGNGGVGGGGFFGAGFPIEDAIDCDPGGTLTFDFQLFTNATVALATIFGVLESMQVTAGIYGTAGNGRTIELIDPGAPNVPLSIAILPDGVSVEVTLGTDGGGVITSTFLEVMLLFQNTPSLVGVMQVSIVGTDPNEVMAAFGPEPLLEGLASEPIDIFGVLMGDKVFTDC